MHVGLIGYGYWGKILAQALAKDQRVSLLSIVSKQPLTNEQVRESFSSSHLQIRVCSMAELQSEALAGVVIATPEETHLAIAEQFISKGVPCFVEKPLGQSLHAVKQLTYHAEQLKTKLHVDHVFIYDQQFKQWVDFCQQHRIEVITDVITYRSAPMDRQKTVSVTTDILPHDLYMFRIGFAWELTKITTAAVTKWRTTENGHIADTVIVSADMKPRHQGEVLVSDTNLISYQGYFSWSGQTKKRLMLFGNRETKEWLCWNSTAPTVSNFELWRDNICIYSQECLPITVTAVETMMSAWLDTITIPWREYLPTMRDHWSGVVRDTVWIERAEQLTSKE